MRRWSAGLREGLLLGGRDCDDGGETREDSDCCFFGEREDSIPASATGIVDVVVCEGGNCITSVLGQGICTRIHETGHHVKAWCETSSHVKVERMVAACDWPTRGTSCHRTKQSQWSAAMRTLWTPKISTFRRSPGCTQVQVDFNELARCTSGTWFVTPVKSHTNA